MNDLILPSDLLEKGSRQADSLRSGCKLVRPGETPDEQESTRGDTEKLKRYNDSPDYATSEHEHRTRLDVPVKQSEDVAKHLTEAMAAEKQRNEDERAATQSVVASVADTLYAPTTEGRNMQPNQVEGVR